MSDHPKSMRAHFAKTPDRTLVPMKGDGLQVFSWCPTPDASGPATQVHVHIPVPEVNATFIARFHSPHTLTEFINALISHRDDVWPKGKGS